MKTISCAVLSILLTGLSLVAQDRSSMEVQLNAGYRNSIVEGTCSNAGGQLMAGASFRYHLTARTSIGPEFMYVRRCDRQGFTFYHPQASGMFQIVREFSEGKVRPYLIGGVGFVSHKSQFADAPIKAEVAGGAGVKIFASDRVFVAPEVQLGGEVFFARFNVGVGFIVR